MNSFCLILLVSTLAILSPCRGDDTTLLPLDGSVLTGSVKFNAVHFEFALISAFGPHLCMPLAVQLLLFQCKLMAQY